jgi:hypothetical protein
MAVKIQLRRDTSTNWSTINPVLAQGEPGYETDTGKVKFGDGSLNWNSLSYFADGASLTIEQVEDTLGTSFLVAGSGIVLNYNDSGNALTISSSGVTLEQIQDNLGTSFLVAGTGISLSYNDGSDTLTINATSVANSGDNRILTSTGTSTGINAEANMTFNGTSLIVSGNAKFTQVHPTVSDVATTSGSITSNISTGQIFDITINGSTTLSNPTNSIDGVTVRWRITQGGSGSNSISLGGKFNIPSSATSPLPWSTGVGATDLLAATYDSGRDEWDIIAFVPGY